jgi:hypothetical protein
MVNTELQPEVKRRLRSHDFRYIPCDAISLALSDNGVKLILGIDEVDGTALDLVGVHVSHKTAWALKVALSQALEHHQKETGVTFDEPELTPG